MAQLFLRRRYLCTTDDGRWTPTHSNRSPEWLRWPLDLYLFCIWILGFDETLTYIPTSKRNLCRIKNFFLLTFFVWLAHRYLLSNPSFNFQITLTSWLGQVLITLDLISKQGDFMKNRLRRIYFHFIYSVSLFSIQKLL